MENCYSTSDENWVKNVYGDDAGKKSDEFEKTG